MAYICDIVSTTEQYFCPIREALKILDAPRLYMDFLKYSDGDAYEKKLKEFRMALSKK